MANQPVKRIKVGSVEVAIWKNEYKDKKTEKVLISFSYGAPTKSYKDKSDKWQTTNNLKSGEALNAIVCYQKAFEWVYMESKSEETKDVETSEPKF